VGWPRPNRSHFKAADQWATGSPAGEGPGWIAAAFDQRRAAGPLVALGPAGSTALEGGEVLALQLAPAQLRGRLTAPLEPQQAGSNPVLRQMLELELAGQRELQRLRGQLAPLPPGLAMPRGALGQQVALALRLIGSGACPPVLQLAQGGYDTHSNQAGRHGRVLTELAEALAAFAAGLERLPNRPPVSLLAVSEFGRLHRPVARRPAARPLPRHLPQPHHPRRPRRPDRQPQPAGAVPAGAAAGGGVRCRAASVSPQS